MSRKYKLNEKGYCDVLFVRKEKKAIETPEEETPDDEIEIETFQHSPRSFQNEDNNTLSKSSDLNNEVVIEEDWGGEDINRPRMFYGKLRTLNSEIKEEEYDEGYDANNICHHISIPSFPVPTISELKLAFLKVMSRDDSLNKVSIYRLYYPTPGDSVDDSEIVLPDGRRGQVLGPDAKNIQDFGVVDGDFFEIEINEN
jgi:hypothetical protein